MTFSFDKKLFAYLSFTFILMTIIGTLTHEYGHYISAKILGFNSRINYGMTILENNSMSRRESFIVTLGGPMQTMLTGSLGLVLLYAYRKSFDQIERLSLLQWTFVFTSLFWLRQVSNMFTWVLFYFINGKFLMRGDEIKIARYLELPKWSILSATALIGVFVLWKVIFKFIPEKVRFTFIISGIFWWSFGIYIMAKVIWKNVNAVNQEADLLTAVLRYSWFYFSKPEITQPEIYISLQQSGKLSPQRKAAERWL